MAAASLVDHPVVEAKVMQVEHAAEADKAVCNFPQLIIVRSLRPV